MFAYVCETYTIYTSIECELYPYVKYTYAYTEVSQHETCLYLFLPWFKQWR